MSNSADIEKEDPYDTWVKSARGRFAEIDPERLARYIEGQPDVTGPVEIKSLQTLKDGAGMSNGIAFLHASLDMGNGREDRQLVLRYDPGVSLIKQKSFSDEYLTLLAVRRAGLPVPVARWLDPDGSRLGCAGFLMDRIDGTAPSMAMFQRGPIADAAPEDRREMMLSAAGMLGKLKQAAIAPEDAPHLLLRGEGEDHICRELNWWLTEAALNADKEEPAFKLVQELHDWLRDNRPPARPATLTHGDGQIANMMFKDGHIAAWLDWELAYFGYQESDLMMMLMITDLTRPPEGTVEGVPTEAEYVARFEAESGAPVEHFAYFKLFMVYKYFVGLLFARDVIPDFDQIWMAITAYRDTVWPTAKSEAKLVG